MGIEKLAQSNIKEVVNLWNTEREKGRFIHKDLKEEEFINKFIKEDGLKKVSLVYKVDDKIVGFGNGCCKENTDTAYLTFVLVDSEYTRKGIGKSIVNALEGELKKNNELKKIDLIFFNPINLEWIVPNTVYHDHPNAPGVDVSSEAYIFFKNMGYRDIVNQNSYYRKLEDFEYTDKIKNKLEELKNNDIEIVYYDKDKHYGFDELFEDLDNPLWKEIITENLNRESGIDPVLIVEHKGKVCGFTGPLTVQDSKRGSFCGIGIHSEYRKHGAGKVLFSALCKGLKDQGAEYMTLFTGENNPARNIYESANFKIVRTWADMRKEIK